jgi:carbon storage regulator
MLMLGRRVGDSIMIGDEIRVVVVSFDGRMVKLGVDAPKDIPVHRTEVYERIKNGEDRRPR